MTKRSEWMEGWLSSEDAQQDVIAVKKVYIDINDGNLHDGILFSQIMYWHGRNRETGKSRLTVKRDGELWLAKGYEEWKAECRIIAATARKCIDRMIERGLLIKKLYKFNEVPTVHIRVNWEGLEKRIKSIRPDVSNQGIDTTGQIGSLPQVKSLTETTPEITTETPERARRANGGGKSSKSKRDMPNNSYPERIRDWNGHYLARYYLENDAALDALFYAWFGTGVMTRFSDMNLTERRLFIEVQQQLVTIPLEQYPRFVAYARDQWEDISLMALPSKATAFKVWYEAEAPKEAARKALLDDLASTPPPEPEIQTYEEYARQAREMYPDVYNK